MKKFLVMAAMVLSSVGAFAQYEGGEFTIQPKVGLNASSTSGDGTKFKAGFVGGVEGEYHFSKLVGLSVGVLYSQEGNKLKDGSTSFYEDGKNIGGLSTNQKLNLAYINVPILANVYVAKGLAVKAGIQPGFKVSAKNKFEASIAGKSASYNEDLEGVNSVNFSIPVGISYEYANVCLDARYNIGVSHMFKDGDVTGQVFQLTLGYKFKL